VFKLPAAGSDNVKMAVIVRPSTSTDHDVVRLSACLGCTSRRLEIVAVGGRRRQSQSSPCCR